MSTTIRAFMSAVATATLFTSIACNANADQPTKLDMAAAFDFRAKAEEARKAEDHLVAGRAYEQAVSRGIDEGFGWYLAVRSYVQAGEHASALSVMAKQADSGWRDFGYYQRDKLFDPLRGTAEFARIIEQMKANAKKQDPAPDSALVNFRFKDAENFFHAFKLGEGKSIPEKKQLYLDHYFNQASPAMIDYISMKMSSIDRFVAHIEKNRAYYANLENSMKALKPLADKASEAMLKIKQYGKNAAMPDVHYLVGMHTSGGTASPEGLLLGLEFIPMDEENRENLPEWTLSFLSKPVDRLWVIVHEYVHYLQSRGPSSVLEAALNEGGADFLANMFYGHPSKPSGYAVYGQKHHAQIKERFLSELDNEDFSDWSGNNGTDYGDSWHADLAYYIGEVIVRGYYENSTDKEEAIRAILAMNNPKEMLEQSGFLAQ